MRKVVAVPILVRKMRIVKFPLLISFLIALGVLSSFALRIQDAEAATERQSPDGLLQQDNLSGALSDIQDDPDSPDANWLTYITDNVNTVTRVSFPTPTGDPTVGADLQEFKIWVRQQPDGAGADPTVRIELYENGSSLGTILADTAVSSTSGAFYSGTWNANLLGAADGSLVECYIYGTAVGGGPSDRCTVEVGAVEWNVDYTPPTPTITVASSVSQPPNVTTPSTLNVMGAFSIVTDYGTSSVTAVVLKDTGTIDATNELENVELWLSSDKTWDADDTQLDTAKNFTGGVDGTCTFSPSPSFDVTTTTQYLIVRLDVKSGVTPDETIEIQIQDITTTDQKSGLPCNLSGTTTVTASWWNASWSYRKKLTFNNSAQSENLTNFPVLVKLTTSNFNYADAKSDGTDLRFIDSDNTTELKYHIEKWNPSGDSFVWVKVPQIDGSSNTDYIYMYYGYGSATDVQSSTSTFSNSYRAVWHMDEASWNGTAGEVKDSTLNANDGTAAGNATTTTAGQVNGCGTFDGNGDYVEVADSASLDVTNLTINAWVNSTDFTPSDYLRAYNRIIVSKTDGKVGYQLGLTTENKPYFAFEDISVNNVSKYNNAIPANSDTSSTDGRIPLGTSGKGDDGHTLPSPSVIKDGTTYKIWYTGYDGTNYRIFYATSPDGGLTWTKYDNTIPANSDGSSTNGRIPLGTTGKGDDAHSASGSVIKDGSTYKMWYGGHDGTNWRIYYATSTDGLTWTKYDNTVPSASDTSSTNGRIPLGSAEKGDSAHTYNSAVIKDGSTYKMWYAGHDGSAWRIFYATSPDGLTWTKYDNTIPAASDTSSTNGRIPLGTDGKGDDYYTYHPCVIKDGSIYRMWYTGCDGPTAPNIRIYYATSPDGLVWTKYDNTVPTASDTTSTNGRIPLGTAGKGDDNGVCMPAAIKDGSTYKIWYSAHDGSNYRIYYATLETGVTSSTAVPSEFRMLSGVADTTADTIKLYVNGSLDTSGTTSVNGVNNSEELTIGNLLNGKIDEVRISTATRSADWISAKYLSMTCQFISFPPPADPQIQSTTHTDGAKSNVAIATFTCTAGEPAPDHYHYLWDQTATHTRAEVSAGTQWDGTELNKTCTSDGDWYLHAISHDASHIESANTDTFHIDYNGTAPQLNSTATAQNPTTVRIVYNEAVKHISASNSDDALNPNNYSIAPSLTVTSVAHVSGDTTFDLTTAEQTPSQSYTITVTNVEDEYGNVIDPAYDEATFTGFGEGDETAPGQITTLSALTGNNVGEINLSWTAPGDDGYTEDIVGGKYRIDYSTDPLYNFTTYYYKIEFSTDTSPGDPQSYTLDSLNQTTYYIRIYTADEVPNWSPLSNGATAFPGAPSTGTVSLSAATIDGWIRAKDNTGGPQPDIFERQLSEVINFEYYEMFGPYDTWARGFVEWDISSIPDDATITDVVFKYHGEENHASSLTYIYQMGIQPSIQINHFDPDVGGNDEIWTDAADGTAYLSDSPTFPEVGENKEIDLGSSAVSDLQSNLTTNWFAIGLKNDEGTAGQKDSIFSSRYGTVNPPPTLYVTFTPGQDTTPPASITNLSALTGDVGGQVKLSWTAPGDDGTSGDICSGKYRIKYSQDSNYNWNVSDYDIEWTTTTSPGASQSRIIENLTFGATYYFRIWTGDEIPNWSTVSNSASAMAQVDVTAPGAITTLSALTGDNGGEVKLTWSAPGDDGWDNPISGGKYGVKWSTYASFDWGGASDFNLEWSTSTSPGNSESKVVAGLTGGTTYYFRIWTADEIPNWSSGLSNGATAMAKIVAGANRYWVGASNPDNWDDADNWSATSGGGGGAGVPGPEDTAIFDGENTTSCQIDISSTVASVIIYSTYTATISINSGESLTTSGSFEIAGGTFTTNGEILDVGSYNQTGGIFNAGGSTVTCNGDFSVTVGTFNAGASVLVLDATDGNATFTGDGYTFNNVIFQSTGTVARTWTLGGGTITFNGNFQLKAQGTGNLTVTAVTNNPDLDIDGSVDYIGTGAGTELVSMGDGTWTVGGNVDFSDGTVDASTSTFVLNGSSTQTLTMDGNSLNILQITNSSSEGVYFADSLSLSTFTATTGNTRLYFCGGSTFTFTNIELDGQSESNRIVLKSTSTGTAWYLTVTGNQSVSYVNVEDSDASGGDTILAIDGTSINSGNNVKWDFGPPAAITDLTGLCDSGTGDVTLSWSTPGDDDWSGTLPSGSKYIIDYSTYSIQWSTTTYDVEIATSGVAPYTEVSHKITGLTGDTTWYFKIWTRDEVPANWSGLSNGATVWVNPILSISISTDTYNFGTIDCATSTVSGSTITVTNDGNVIETYSIKCSSTTKWTPQNTPGPNEFTLQSAFHPSEPTDDDLIWETDDILTDELEPCTTAVFSIDGTEHGKEVPPFDNNDRKLWFRLKMPLATSTTDQQNITITINAEKSP